MRRSGRACTPLPPASLHIVVLSELPRTRETLLLRLLGRSRVRREAIEDLAALPGDAWEKRLATPLLVHFRLGPGEVLVKENDVNTAEIRAWHQEYEKKLKADGAREVLLRMLQKRFGELPEAAAARIQAAGPAEIEQWSDRLLTASSLAQVLGDS